MGDYPDRPARAPGMIAAPLRAPPGITIPDSAAQMRLAQRHATMARGCAFLRQYALNAPAPVTTRDALVELRRAGNCLNELDRFLSVLLDACAMAAGMADKALAGFERSPDTARKLRRLDTIHGVCGTETQRLQAIDRLRRICRGDGRGAPRSVPARDWAMALPGIAPGDMASDRPLRIDGRALADIAQFYLALADRLLAQCGGRNAPGPMPVLTFRRNRFR